MNADLNDAECRKLISKAIPNFINSEFVWHLTGNEKYFCIQSVDVPPYMASEATEIINMAVDKHQAISSYEVKLFPKFFITTSILIHPLEN